MSNCEILINPWDTIKFHYDKTLTNNYSIIIYFLWSKIDVIGLIFKSTFIWLYFCVDNILVKWREYSVLTRDEQKYSKDFIPLNVGTEKKLLLQ